MAIGAGVVGIELSVGQLRVIHGAASGHSLQIYDFETEEILIPNPESVAQQLSALMAKKGLRSLPAALAISGPGVVHRLLEFPVMPPKELTVVVERESRTFGGEGGADVAFDWEVIENSEQGNLRQVQVLVAMAPRSQVEEAQQLLTHCRLKPALVTTVPISLLRSLKFVEGGEKGLRALLYLGDQQGYLLAANDGIWDFYREFSRSATEEGLSVFVGEANRAVLYYRQRYQEKREIGFLLGGRKGLEELKGRLQSEITTQGIVVQPGVNLDLDTLEERGTLFRTLFPSFIVPLGLVTAASLKTGINLIRKSAKRSLISWPSVTFPSAYRPVYALSIALFFVCIHLFVFLTERHYTGLLEERALLYAHWIPTIKSAKESRELHDVQRLLEDSFGPGDTGEISWVRLFKSLSHVVSPNLILKSMTVQRGKGNWSVMLSGEIVSSDSHAAHTVFNSFYQALKRSRVLEKVRLLPLTVSTFEERVALPVGGDSEELADKINGRGMRVKKTRIQFEVRGQMKGTVKGI